MRGSMAVITTLLFLLLATGIHAFAQDISIGWQQLDDGLQLALLDIDTQPADDLQGPVPGLTILRIAPKVYEFVALTSTELDLVLTPEQWADEYDLTAVINASMYLPDKKTSTGYLRNGEHLNNAFVNKRFGNFFVADPLATPRNPNATEVPPGMHSLAPVAILDRQTDDWENGMEQYSIVVQNFRMLSAAGTPLWPEDGDAFSIAAVGQDESGNILFIHCRPPLTVRRLTEELLALPLGIVRAMYVEGGPQASLHVRAGTIRQTWSGRHAGDFWSMKDAEWLLPNVIGIRKRAAH